MTLLLQDGTGLDLQDGADVLDVQSGGNVVVPPVPIITPGSLGAASYPSFFPCPEWEYSQDVNGHLGRTLFDSGWIRQRRTWREQNTSVAMTFVMKTTMFDRWNLWMVNNGYEWFTMYLDRFAGEKVLTEVRLVAPISWEYDSYDNVIVRVGGELGKGVHEYGPQGEPLDGTNDFGDFCVPVYITDPLQNTTAYIDEVIVLAVDFNEDATTPVAFTWYEDNILIPGETGPSLTYTIPTVGSILEEQQVTITVNITNDCGSVWSTSVITIPPDPACAPYACDALREEMRYRSQVTGFGVWDLMDPNFTDTVPQFMRRVSSSSGPGELAPSSAGATFVRGVGISRTDQIDSDSDLCEGPYVIKNTDGVQENFYFPSRATWGAFLPTACVAVVTRNVDVGAVGKNPDNEIFSGGTGYRTYNASVTGSVTHNIRIARNSAETEERIYFNFNTGPGEFSLGPFPLGYFSGSIPKLLELVLEVTDVEFVASSNQLGNDRYDWNCTCKASAWVTDSSNGAMTSYENLHKYRVAELQTPVDTNPAEGDPMPNQYKPYTYPTFMDLATFLEGGIGAMYNLAIDMALDGSGDGMPFVEGGYSPGRVGSSIHTAFMRNSTSYGQPAYCSLPENTTRVRRRT